TTHLSRRRSDGLDAGAYRAGGRRDGIDTLAGRPCVPRHRLGVCRERRRGRVKIVDRSAHIARDLLGPIKRRVQGYREAFEFRPSAVLGEPSLEVSGLKYLRSRVDALDD